MIWFSGCVAGQNMPNSSKVSDKLEIPQSINFAGKTFHKRYEDAEFAEYYLQGNPDFAWQELITISYINGNDLGLWANLLDKNLKNENVKYELYTKANELLEVELYYPDKTNTNYNSFEANVALTSTKECGMATIRYAKNFDESQNSQKLWKKVLGNATSVAKNFPKIECKNK